MTPICAKCKFCSKPGYEYAKCLNDRHSWHIPGRINPITGEEKLPVIRYTYCQTNNSNGQCSFWEPIPLKPVVPETPKKSLFAYLRQLWTRT